MRPGMQIGRAVRDIDEIPVTLRIAGMNEIKYPAIAQILERAPAEHLKKFDIFKTLHLPGVGVFVQAVFSGPARAAALKIHYQIIGGTLSEKEFKGRVSGGMGLACKISICRTGRARWLQALVGKIGIRQRRVDLLPCCISWFFAINKQDKHAKRK